MSLLIETVVDLQVHVQDNKFEERENALFAVADDYSHQFQKVIDYALYHHSDR